MSDVAFYNTVKLPLDARGKAFHAWALDMWHRGGLGGAAFAELLHERVPTETEPCITADRILRGAERAGWIERGKHEPSHSRRVFHGLQGGAAIVDIVDHFLMPVRSKRQLWEWLFGDADAETRERCAKHYGWALPAEEPKVNSKDTTVTATPAPDRAAPGETRFTVARAVILPALESCAAVADPASAVHQFRSVRIDANGALTLRASSGTQSLTLRNRAAEVRDAGAVLVNAKDVADRVRQFSEGPIEFATKPNGRIEIRRGRDRFQLSTLDASLFPVVDGETQQGPIAALAPLLTALARLADFTGTRGTDTPAVCKNVCLQTLAEMPGKLVLLSSNGHGAARVTIPIEARFNGEMLVAAEAAKKASKILSGISGEARFAMLGSTFWIWTPDVTYSALAAHIGEFPGIGKHIPPRAGPHFQIARHAALDAVKALRLTKPKMDMLTLWPDGDGMMFGATDEEGNPSERAIVTDGTIEKMGFSSEYALTCLGFHADEEVIIWQAHPLAQVVFTPVAESDDVILVMPQRV